jgi:hypothetical protein
VSRSGWFRRQQSLLVKSGASAQRIWSRSRVGGGAGKRRGVAVTASSAALVLVSGIAIVAFAAPGSHASAVATAASASRAANSRPAQPAAALQVVSVTPAAGAKGVNGASTIRVQFSAPLAASSPMPTLSPQIAGTWTAQGDSAVFTPAVGYTQDTHVTA